MTVLLTIPGKPLAQGRPRARRTKSGHVVMYDPKKSKDWKGSAQYLMAQAASEQGWEVGDSPLRVEIRAIFPCPKSDHRKRRPRPARWHTKQGGDVDNIAKAVLDAGNGVLWLDDAQVVQLEIGKMIAPQGEPPRVEVAAWRAEEL